MQNDPRADIKYIWQNQKSEASNMSIELIRYKAQQLEGTLRRQAIAARVAGVGIIAASFYVLWRFDQPFIRAGAAVLVLWAVNLAYQSRKRARPERLAPDATLNVSIDFYRQELEHQRFYTRAGGKTLWPVLISTALLLTPAFRAGLLAKFSPFLIVMAVWAVALIIVERRKLRALQREVDELAGLPR